MACVGCGFGGHATQFPSCRGSFKIIVVYEVRQEDTMLYSIGHSFGIGPTHFTLRSLLLGSAVLPEHTWQCWN